MYLEPTWRSPFDFQDSIESIDFGGISLPPLFQHRFAAKHLAHDLLPDFSDSPQK